MQYSKLLLALSSSFSCRPPPQATLNCLPPALEPKATDFIEQMIAMIQQIIE